ncbi:MAG: AAA family ATPase [Pirellulales bacterium]
MANQLNRALAWAKTGWPVIPCGTDKRPLIDKWQIAATTDAERIRKWWLEFHHAIPGVVPGLAGCFAIDVDTKKGDGFATLAKLEQEHALPLYDAPQQDTPSRGRHYFLRGICKTTVGATGLGDFIDTRGGSADGGLGYVVAYADEPPGDPNSCPFAPASILAAAGELRAVDTERATPARSLDLPENIARARMWLKDQPTPLQDRNHRVFKLATHLKDFGLSLATIYETLEEFPHALGDPPLNEDDPNGYNATVRSAWVNGQLQPGIESNSLEAFNGILASLPDLPPAPEAGPNFGSGRKSIAPWSSRRSRPSPPWLIRGLVPAGGLIGLYGAGGSYKSFLALDLAASVAGGVHEDGAGRWGGREILHPGPVVYVSGEGSAEPRLRAIEAHRRRQLPDDLTIFDGLDLGDTDACAEFNDALQAAKRDVWGGRDPALIIFDTLARSAPNVEENSNKEMGGVIAMVDRLRAAYGCAVILVHHTPKDSPHVWRGATAAWNALDTALLVMRSDDALAATLSIERQKEGATGAEWAITLEPQQTGVERDGEPEEALVCASITPRKLTRAQAAAQRNENTKANDLHRLNRMVEIIDGAGTETISLGAVLTQYTAECELPQDRAALRRWMQAQIKKGSALTDRAHGTEFLPQRKTPAEAGAFGTENF